LHVNIVTRSSTRVSPGFNQFKHSSQSFGSQKGDLRPVETEEGVETPLAFATALRLNHTALPQFRTPWFVLQDERNVAHNQAKGYEPKRPTSVRALIEHGFMHYFTVLLNDFSPFLHSTSSLSVINYIFSLWPCVGPN